MSNLAKPQTKLKTRIARVAKKQRLAASLKANLARRKATAKAKS